MSKSGKNDDPSLAQVRYGQQLLFPSSARAVCKEIGLNWWAALKLRDEGWISFDPDSADRLDESQDAELRFVGSLVNGGCDPGMLNTLLSGLIKPYSYKGGKIYYDWAVGRWRLLPEIESNREAIFSDWLEELKEARDLEQLKILVECIEEAITEVRSSKPRQ